MPSEAVAAWRWANFWESRCPPGKRVVYVNLDETSVPMMYPAGQGYVHIPSGTSRRGVLSGEQPCSLAQRRSYMSLVAMLSDDVDVQSRLPQVLMSNRRLLPDSALEELKKALGDSERKFVWRRQSAWVDASAMIRILQLLRESLQPIWQNIHVVLLLDCCPVHASKKVVATAGRLGFHLVMVPASMTGVLQPLDAYAFAGLKKRHRDSVLQDSTKSASGAIDVVTHCRLLFDAVESYLSKGSWAQAFRGCGFGAAQQHVGHRARVKLQWPEGPPQVGSRLPSFPDLEAVWLRGKHVLIDELFRLIHHPEEATARVDAGDTPCASNPWAGRLRSRSARPLAPAVRPPPIRRDVEPPRETPLPWRRKFHATGIRLGPWIPRPPA